MRPFKSRAEVDTMREAARIAARAHVRAMKACEPGQTRIRNRRRGGTISRQRRISYLPIVGGGANGCILHYRE
jgi:Xaa-Pro aminopeptidase